MTATGFTRLHHMWLESMDTHTSSGHEQHIQLFLSPRIKGLLEIGIRYRRPNHVIPRFKSRTSTRRRPSGQCLDKIYCSPHSWRR